ncbi:MAG: cob(I)yrinic acid a,c-diamide adenosyltransferase [Minisyncoccia bacterium]
MLYTRKGDDGTTKTFGCDQRISKSSAIAEALGSLDEANSFLGLCKIKSEKEKLLLPDNNSVAKTIHNVQKNLFIIQAEIAGSPMSIEENKIKEMEKIIDDIEKELPPIKSFFISGGAKLAAYFDIARTILRRAERRVVEVSEEKKVKVSEFSSAYLNRLSSLLYALARLTNHKFGIKEESPDYE